MNLFPAIDLYDGKAVRLYQGDYARMTVYRDDPLDAAAEFVRCGAAYLHVVDLQGARDGGTPQREIVARLKRESGLFTEVGGGVRDLQAVESYLFAGVDRVIFGTAAVTDETLVRDAVRRYGDRIAVGIDLIDGRVATRGWTERSSVTGEAFFDRVQDMGVSTVICTDISRDGAMRGANHALYRSMSRRFNGQIIASGGVSSLADITALKELGLYGAIIGKAYYTGALDLKTAIEVAR